MGHVFSRGNIRCSLLAFTCLLVLTMTISFVHSKSIKQDAKYSVHDYESNNEFEQAKGKSISNDHQTIPIAKIDNSQNINQRQDAQSVAPSMSSSHDIIANPSNHRASSSLTTSLTSNGNHKSSSQLESPTKLIMNQSPPMNLIPVDQPLSWSSSQQQSQSVSFEDDSSLTSNAPSASASALSTSSPSSLGSPAGLSMSREENQAQQWEAIKTNHINQMQHQVPDNVLFESMMSDLSHDHAKQKALFYADSFGDDRSSGSKNIDNGYAIAEQNYKSSVSPVDRRFGLLKKAALVIEHQQNIQQQQNQQQHHQLPQPQQTSAYGSNQIQFPTTSIPYGAPQALLASATAAGLMSDCDRCIVSVSGSPYSPSSGGPFPAFSGQLQDAEPLSPTPTPQVIPVNPSNAGGGTSSNSGLNPPPVLVPSGAGNLPAGSQPPMPLPMPIGGGYGSMMGAGYGVGTFGNNPIHPLKSKLFMKFPFLIKSHKSPFQMPMQIPMSMPMSMDNSMIGPNPNTGAYISALSYANPLSAMGMSGIPMAMSVPFPVAMPLQMGLPMQAAQSAQLNAPDAYSATGWHYGSPNRPHGLMTGAIYLKAAHQLPVTSIGSAGQATAYHCVHAGGSPSSLAASSGHQSPAPSPFFVPNQHANVALITTTNQQQVPGKQHQQNSHHSQPSSTTGFSSLQQQQQVY